jgi:hypothetical protein
MLLLSVMYVFYVFTIYIISSENKQLSLVFDMRQIFRNVEKSFLIVIKTIETKNEFNLNNAHV